MQMKVVALTAILSVMAISGIAGPERSAKAAVADGSANLICAVIDAIECQADGSCFQGRASDINLPQFFYLQFDEMVVKRKTPDGEERNSKIDSLRHDAGELIIQGVEEGLAWSLLLDEEVGRMTLTASKDDLGYVIFGACTLD